MSAAPLSSVRASATVDPRSVALLPRARRVAAAFFRVAGPLESFDAFYLTTQPTEVLARRGNVFATVPHAAGVVAQALYDALKLRALGEGLPFFELAGNVLVRYQADESVFVPTREGRTVRASVLGIPIVAVTFDTEDEARAQHERDLEVRRHVIAHARR